MQINKAVIRAFLLGVLRSYSQVFFSDHRLFAGILLLVSFFDVWAGLSGLLAILITNLLAISLGYNRMTINKGGYGFNSLLVGLGTGLYFQPGIELFVVVFFAAILTFFITVAVEGILGKYGLPYLSVPFLFGMWIIALSVREFNALGVSERGIYIANDMYLLGGQKLLDLYYWWGELEIAWSLKVYFYSLGAIFFQYNLLSGILIAIGLLIFSRIAFTLSLIGFYAAFYFYQIIGADIAQLSYTYIGFNFILTSIALAGFYMVPGRSTYLWVLLVLPVVVLLTISSSRIFEVFRISIYALPFNAVVLTFLYAMKLRYKYGTGLKEVQVQLNSPEKNLYFFHHASQRFKEQQYLPLQLPFYGQWTVSQAHNGEHTHKEDWRFAWDFVITDENDKQHKGQGNRTEDYHCYGKKVIAPADGSIQEINDGIEDNAIGDVNLSQNWGNSIVIKHSEYLYSQVSHLKSGSIKVNKGDVVRKGQLLGIVGNSGRSPYPHLHFQLQATPFVGSATLDYPVSYYIRKKDNGFDLRSFDKPQLGDKVANIEQNILLKRALHFIPGQKLDFMHTVNGSKEEIHWEIKADAFNNSYIHCAKTNSFAYFYNNGVVHYFKNFVGDRKSLLFVFYLALFRVQTGYYKDLEIHDSVPVNQTFGRLRLFFQDFIAPFWFFLKSSYRMHYAYLDDELSPSRVLLKSQVTNRSMLNTTDHFSFAITISKKGIERVEAINNKKVESAWQRV